MILIEGDLSTIGEGAAHCIAEETLQHGVVVLRNQNLTPDEEVRVCKMIGNVQEYTDTERTKHIACHPNILRVTGQKDQHGEPGLFGHTSALDWHANQASNYDRDPLIWLYGVEGTAGSCTSWIDMRKAYEDLPRQEKKSLQKIKITLGYKSGSYSDSKFFVEHHATDKPFDLVYTNEYGITGLYFPFLQIFGMQGLDRLQFEDTMSMLKEHVLQDEYRYDHYWQDGDVVISEQWLTIHKRWECDFMEDRVLHRIAFDYSKVKV